MGLAPCLHSLASQTERPLQYPNCLAGPRIRLLSEEASHLYLQAVKAMRFEPGAHKKKLEKVQRERTVSDEEIAKAIEDSLDED